MAETYTLKLLVDDTAVRRLESRINRIMGMNMPGEQKGQQTVYGMFQKLPKFLGNIEGIKQLFSSGSVKKFLKLATIVGFIPIIISILNSIKDAVVRSSPLLGGALKILDSAMMFFFRPFGDFLGALLIPIATDLLRFFADWYKWASPAMRDLGELLGENWKAFLSPLLGISDLVQNVLDRIGLGEGGPGMPGLPDFGAVEMPTFEGVSQWFAGIGEKFREFASTLPEKISGWFAYVRAMFRNFSANELLGRIAGWFAHFGGKFVDFLPRVPGIISGWLGKITGKIGEIDLGSVLDMVTKWLARIGTVIGGLESSDIRSFISAWFTAITALIRKVDIGSMVRRIVTAIFDLIRNAVTGFFGGRQGQSTRESNVPRNDPATGIPLQWGGSGHTDGEFERRYRGLRRN